MSIVALRKESVDRNFYRQRQCGQGAWSLSARRAWIEIALYEDVNAKGDVALRKESVDRNWMKTSLRVLYICRSPQGERG